MQVMSVEGNMPLGDKFRLYLANMPDKFSDFDIESLQKTLGFKDKQQVYNVISRLETKGEIKVIREEGRIRQIELVKSAGAPKIIEQVADRVIAEADKTTDKPLPISKPLLDENKIPLLKKALTEKARIIKATQTLSDVGVPVEEISNLLDNYYKESPLAEEAYYLLSIIESLQMSLNSVAVQRNEAQIRLSEQREKAQYWSSKVRRHSTPQEFSKMEHDAPWATK